MLISVFTPTHDTRVLAHAWASLKRQSYQNWEWVILLNGSALDAENPNLPVDLLEDPRVKVHRTNSAPFVGLLKGEACDLCAGELLVELDHDDELRSDCLQRLAAAMADEPEGFFYSDWVERQPNGESRTYNPFYGWEKYETWWDYGGTITAQRAMSVTARSLYQIFFAPNHVRAWSRAAYNRVGGYNRQLSVCDDHELLIRTYLAGVPMVHIPECLYMQHIWPNQTQTLRNQEIQIRQAEIGAQYLERLALEWSRRQGLKNYDLGAAHNPAVGYTSVDLQGAEVCIDVTKGLPFEDNSVGVIRAYDFLEHLPAGKSVIEFMNECYRVLAPGGWMLTHTPNTEGRGAFQDPTHVSFWNSNSFWYYTKKEFMKYVPELKAQFQLTRVVNHFPSKWHQDHLISYVSADLWALKGQPQCGADLTK